MTEDNVIRLPQPDEDALDTETRIAEVARLAERVADLIGTDDRPMPIGELLDRIESASQGLSEIGGITLAGSDRLKMQAVCQNVQAMIGRIRTTLAQTGVELGKDEHD